MNHRHPGGSAPFLLLALLAPLGTGCSEAFKDCVEEWQDCSQRCPSEEEEAEILAAAEEARRDCLEHCGSVTDPANAKCIKQCLEDFNYATQLIGCSDECDAEFRDCVDSIPTS